MMNSFFYRIKEWTPVFVLSFMVFVFGISEFVPIGLLPDIAKSLNKTESHVGLLLTAYAWTVAIFSLPLTMLTAKMERKKLITIVLSVFILGNLFVSMSRSFELIMISRIVIALSHAIFWSIIPPLAFKISPNGKSSYGLAAISVGASASSILGIPLCTYIGHKFGWNVAFYIIVFISFMVLLVLFLSLPKIKPQKNKRKLALYRIRKNKTLFYFYLGIIIFIAGYFTFFTYIVPFLIKYSGFSQGSIAYVLTAFGVFGLLGILATGKILDKYMQKLTVYPIVFGALILALWCLLGFNKVNSMILMLLFGLSISSVFPAFSGWIISLSKKDSDMASSIYTSLFNIGIGTGAMLGGIYIKRYDISYLGYISAVVFLIASVIIYFFGTYLHKKPKRKISHKK